MSDSRLMTEPWATPVQGAEVMLRWALPFLTQATTVLLDTLSLLWIQICISREQSRTWFVLQSSV